MKLTLTTDEGTILNIWEHIDMNDLNKGMAAADLIEDLRREIKVGQLMELEEAQD